MWFLEPLHLSRRLSGSSAARIIQDAVETKPDLIKALISQVGLFNRDDNGREETHDGCFPSFSQVGYDMSLQIYLSS